MAKLPWQIVCFLVDSYRKTFVQSDKASNRMPQHLGGAVTAPVGAVTKQPRAMSLRCRCGRDFLAAIKASMGTPSEAL